MANAMPAAVIGRTQNPTLLAVKPFPVPNPVRVGLVIVYVVAIELVLATMIWFEYIEIW